MQIKKMFLMSIGFLSLGAGIIGIVLPLLPTTPFLLLSILCFSESNERFSTFLLKSKTLKSYVENYQNKTGIPFGVKARSLIFLWGTLIASMLLFHKDKEYLFIILPLVGAGVTLHILLIKTRKKT